MPNPVNRRQHPVRRRVATALIVAVTATSFLPSRGQRERNGKPKLCRMVGASDGRPQFVAKPR